MMQRVCILLFFHKVGNSADESSGKSSSESSDRAIMDKLVFAATVVHQTIRFPLALTQEKNILKKVPI